MNVQNRTAVGLTALVAMALALSACGEGPVTNVGSGTLEVACVPPAEIWIDGTSHGSTPQTLTLPAGEHTVLLKRDAFEDLTSKVDVKAGTTSTLDATLLGTDPGDPAVIRDLAAAAEVAYEPFEEGERSRGAGSTDLVTLLWPQKDVRMEGLTSFAIEVSQSYEGNGSLEFRRGRKVLHEEPFTAEGPTVVAPLPPPVRAAIKKGDTVTWGVFFDRKRDDVTAKFEVIASKSADKALAKLEKQKFYMRQPPLTQALMRAQVLLNKQLYSEAILANLEAAQAFPGSTQPYLGLVTALRRIDGEDSELYAAASQFVSGAGGHGRVRPTVRTRPNATGTVQPGAPARPIAPLGAWNPGPGAVAGGPTLLGTGGDSVRLGSRPESSRTQASEPAAPPSASGEDSSQPSSPPAPEDPSARPSREHRDTRSIETRYKDNLRAVAAARQRLNNAEAKAAEYIRKGAEPDPAVLAEIGAARKEIQRLEREAEQDQQTYIAELRKRAAGSPAAHPLDERLEKAQADVASAREDATRAEAKLAEDPQDEQAQERLKTARAAVTKAETTLREVVRDYEKQAGE